MIARKLMYGGFVLALLSAVPVCLAAGAMLVGSLDLGIIFSLIGYTVFGIGLFLAVVGSFNREVRLS